MAFQDLNWAWRIHDSSTNRLHESHKVIVKQFNIHIITIDSIIPKWKQYGAYNNHVKNRRPFPNLSACCLEDRQKKWRKSFSLLEMLYN